MERLFSRGVDERILFLKFFVLSRSILYIPLTLAQEILQKDQFAERHWWSPRFGKSGSLNGQQGVGRFEGLLCCQMLSDGCRDGPSSGGEGYTGGEGYPGGEGYSCTGGEESSSSQTK